MGRVAIGREVLAAVSNKNIFHMLQLFVNGIKAVRIIITLPSPTLAKSLFSCWPLSAHPLLLLAFARVQQANISNSMVVALDNQTDSWLAERNVPRYLKKLVSRTGSTDNHATSGLKFKILVDFLSLGINVLLSDVDVIWLYDPFPYLYKDTDVEGMTDGWDEPTSYGYHFGGNHYRVFARNSGMFYLQATHESNQMMKRLARRMEREGTWDQTAYNEEQVSSSIPTYSFHPLFSTLHSHSLLPPPLSISSPLSTLTLTLSLTLFPLPRSVLPRTRYARERRRHLTRNELFLQPQLQDLLPLRPRGRGSARRLPPRLSPRQLSPREAQPHGRSSCVLPRH